MNYGTASSSSESAYRKATSIPYFNNNQMGIPTSAASNADSDVSITNTLTSWAYVESGGSSGSKNIPYRIATSIPYFNDSNRGRTNYFASNADSDTVSENVSYAWQGTSGSGNYRIATSIPYPVYSTGCTVDAIASNADSDSTITTDKYAQRGSGGSNYSYRRATSIPYPSVSSGSSASNSTAPDRTASNVDADTTGTNTGRGISGYNGSDGKTYRIATSIPYPDWSEWHQAGKAVTASNADSDSRSTTGSYSAYNYFDYTTSNLTGYYRKATSIPYPDWSSYYQAGKAVTASNADSDSHGTAETYSAYEYFDRSGATGYYHIATSIPYASVEYSNQSANSTVPDEKASNTDSDTTSTNAGSGISSYGANKGMPYRKATSKLKEEI